MKWSDVRVLFDNGWYSVIAGEYEGEYALGERWNGKGDGLGFPSQAGYPIWHVVPKFLFLPVLHGLLDELSRAESPSAREQTAAIRREIERIGG